MKVTVTVKLRELITALGLSELPLGGTFAPGEEHKEVEVRGEADADELCERVIATRDVRAPMQYSDLRDALAAVRDGDLALARTLFDRMGVLTPVEAVAVQDALPFARGHAA